MTYTEHTLSQWPEFSFFHQADGSFCCDTMFQGLRFGVAFAGDHNGPHEKELMMRYTTDTAARRFNLYVSPEHIALLDWEDKRRNLLVSDNTDIGPYPIELEVSIPSSPSWSSDQEPREQSEWDETPAEASSPLQEVENAPIPVEEEQTI